MARIFKTPFGAQGDTEQVPEAPQGDGSVSLTQGFGYDYEREYEDPAAKDIRREVMNGLFHDITEAVGDIQLTGVAKWDAAAVPYPAGAVVWHNNNAWRSAVGNNSVEPTEGASWSSVVSQKTVTDALDTKADKTTQVIAGTGLSGGGSLAANRTLSVNYGTTAGTAAQGNDSRITGAAQKSANLSDLSSASAARQNLGLGTAATRDVGTSSGDVMGVGAFGVGVLTAIQSGVSLNTYTNNGVFSQNTTLQALTTLEYPVQLAGVLEVYRDATTTSQTYTTYNSNRKFIRTATNTQATNWTAWAELLHTGNILSTTGQSTEYPMTQKAVTDAISNNALGVGQTWQVVTASRSSGTNYTNTTGRTIAVSVSGPLRTSSNKSQLEAAVGGSYIARSSVGPSDLGDGANAFLFLLVPPGATYAVNIIGGAGNFYNWSELR